MSYLQRAQELYDQMVSDRRYLHQHPEVGMELPETTEYVIKRLSEMGCQRWAVSPSGWAGASPPP